MGCIIQNKMIYCASCGKEFRYNKEEINEESLIKKSNDPIIQNPEVMKKQKHGNHRHGKHRHGNPRHATHGHGKNKHRGPERHRKKHQHQWKEHEAKQIMRLGMLTVIALFIHNLPEGLATFSASLINPALGIEIAFATALHNIPEGISVAVPIYSASGSKGKAILYATLSGLAEPVGAVLAWLILAPILSTDILNFMLAFTAGVMVYVSVDVLIPTAKTLEHKHTMIIGFSLGAIIMGISLIFL
ncbi:MAG: ZIP family metal transporter [archaeon]|nr:ZIP family metal transporter [archaeon]